MPLGSAALPLALGVVLYLLYHGSLTRTIWLGLNILDTLRALRLTRPNGRAVGQVTRRKAMRQALILWIVYVAGQSVGSIPDRLLGWLPLYDTVKIIVLCGFLATRVISSTSIYRSLLIPLLRKYQTPIDLSLLLIHSILALGAHYLLWIPLDVVRSVYRQAVGLSAGLWGTSGPVLVLGSVPLLRRSWGRERTEEVEMDEVVEEEAQRISGGEGTAGDGSAEEAPRSSNGEADVDGEAPRRWLTPGPAIPGRLLQTVQTNLPIARTESESEPNLDHGEARDQIPEQARGVTTVSEVSVEAGGLSHAGPSTLASTLPPTLASTPDRPRSGGSTLAVPVVPTLRRSPRLHRTQAVHVDRSRHDDANSAQVIPILEGRPSMVHVFHAGNQSDPSSSEDSGDVPEPVRLLQVGRTRSHPAPRIPSLKSVNVAHNHLSRYPTLPDPKHPALFSAVPPTSKEIGSGYGNVKGNGNGNGNGKAKGPPPRTNQGKSKIGVASQFMTLGGALQVHSAPALGRQGIVTKGKRPGPGPQRSNSVVLPVRPLPRNTTSTNPSDHPPNFNSGSTKDEPPVRSVSAKSVVPLPSVSSQEQAQTRNDPSAPSQAPTRIVTAAKARSVRSTTRSIVISDDVPLGSVAVGSAASRIRAAREATKRVGGAGGVGGVSGDKDHETASVPGKRGAGQHEDERERRKRPRVGV
ncbi:hypothetical protein JCM24511_02539 [Saitozyma sp. JCM 24511]|nr:hypothetical protein JCM24511_02539 [Saitozyma sp. JCM 24511]